VTHSISARLAGIVVTAGLVLAALAVPAATLAADPGAAPSGSIVDEEPTDTQPTDPVPTDAGDEGEVVYDPIFLTPTPDATPMGEVRGITSRPLVTPPPTDTIRSADAAATDAGIRSILVVLAGLSSMVLLLGRLPAARRR
jgi:hypothetical protein